MNRILLFSCLCVSLVLSSCGGSSVDRTVFRITVTNVAGTPSFSATNGSGVTALFSSMVSFIHSPSALLYQLGSIDFGVGLEDFAENADASTLVSNLQFDSRIEAIGIADEPSSGARGLLAPGQTFTLLLSTTNRNAVLSLALCFLQANDLLVVSPPEGISLFSDAGVPVTGDITAQFSLVDIGTEVNESPGIGSNQVIRQGDAPETGVSAGVDDEKAAALVNDGFTYPAVSSLLSVNLEVVEAASLSN